MLLRMIGYNLKKIFFKIGTVLKRIKFIHLFKYLNYNMKSSREELLKSIKNLLISVVPNGKIILFGSQARDDARKDSDWDLLILLDKNRIDDSDFDSISYPLYELGWKEGEQFSPKLYTTKDWMKRSFTPFYKNIEKEGIVL